MTKLSQNVRGLGFSKHMKVGLHLVIWAGMIVVLNSELLDLEWGPMSKADNSLLIPLLFGMLINAILFYGNAYWLIPGLLHTQRRKKYWLWTTILLIGLTWVEVTFDVFYITRYHLSDTMAGLDNVEQKAVVLELIMMFGAMNIFMNLCFWALAFLYRLPHDWVKSERQKQQLLRDKLTAELDFLKAQMNPHFLFNGINSIYHLMEEDIGKAQ